MTSSSTDPRDPGGTPPMLPAGFCFAGVPCGIKKSGRLDLSIIVCERPVIAAGVFTQNQIVAAPVLLCRARTPSSSIRAVVTNSGNANACTGEVGMRDAQEMCRLVASQLGCPETDVLVMSTGVIGKQLPMDRIRRGIEDGQSRLASAYDDFLSAADAICTTDQYRKTAFRELVIRESTYRIAAMAKGAGMIAPNMATMLAVVMTDAPLSAGVAASVLDGAANQSFNRISVDGHTSTNDTMLLLASGQGDPLEGDDLAALQEQINAVAIDLAKMIVADGEGATHVMALQVEGAKNDHDAYLIAKTVAASPLVKTAITGGDPNWGRIVSAAGYAEAEVTPESIGLTICGREIYRLGCPVEFNEAELSETMRQSSEVVIELRVGTGPGRCCFWSSDLTNEYVSFNSEYTT